MTADIVQLPGGVAKEAAKRSRRKAQREASEWVGAVSIAEDAGGKRGILVYEDVDGVPGYVCTKSTSPLLGEALLKAAMKLYNEDEDAVTITVAAGGCDEGA